MAEIALSQGAFSNVKDNAGQALAIAGTQYPEASMTGKSLLGLAQAYGGAAATGKAKSLEALDLAKQLNDPWESAKAQLGLAETMLLAGDLQSAFTNALQAQEVFVRNGNACFLAWHSGCSTPLAPQSNRPIPRGDKRGKVHTGDSQLRRSGFRAHASERRLF